MSTTDREPRVAIVTDERAGDGVRAGRAEVYRRIEMADLLTPNSSL